MGKTDNTVTQDPLPDALSLHPLLQTGSMELVHTHFPDPNKGIHGANSTPYYIGVVSHSAKLQQAISSGALDEFLKEITNLYRSIYGGEPWNEYLICTRDSCAKVFGIGDVYPDHLSHSFATLEAIHPDVHKNMNCPNCAGNLEFFYQPQSFLEQMRAGFCGRIIATLLFESTAKLVGFVLGWETTIHDGWQDKFLKGYGDDTATPHLSYAEYLAEISKYIGVCSADTPIFNSAEWAVDSSARRSGASLPLYYWNNLIAQRVMTRNGEDVPVIGHSLLGSKALDIFRAIGFQSGEPINGSEQVRVYSTLQKLLIGIRAFSERRKQ